MMIEKPFSQLLTNRAKSLCTMPSDGDSLVQIVRIEHHVTTTGQKYVEIRIGGSQPHTQSLPGPVKRLGSPYRGVSFHACTQRWRGRIKHGSKSEHLGYFTSDIEAAKAYNDAAVKIHGEQAQLNDGAEIIMGPTLDNVVSTVLETKRIPYDGVTFYSDKTSKPRQTPRAPAATAKNTSTAAPTSTSTSTTRKSTSGPASKTKTKSKPAPAPTTAIPTTPTPPRVASATRAPSPQMRKSKSAPIRSSNKKRRVVKTERKQAKAAAAAAAATAPVVVPRELALSAPPAPAFTSNSCVNAAELASSSANSVPLQHQYFNCGAENQYLILDTDDEPLFPQPATKFELDTSLNDWEDIFVEFWLNDTEVAAFAEMDRCLKRVNSFPCIEQPKRIRC